MLHIQAVGRENEPNPVELFVFRARIKAGKSRAATAALKGCVVQCTSPTIGALVTETIPIFRDLELDA